MCERTFTREGNLIMNEQPINTPQNDMMGLTADIVTSYVSANKMSSSELTGLISQVHAALTLAGNGKSEAERPNLEPAVPVKNSVKPDYIVCLEDGKKFKSLKRHLRTSYNLTPDEYRAKWGLKHDYPMVAPVYAAKRSELAKSMGLGNLRREAKVARAAPATKDVARKEAKTAKSPKR
jgi:predicted transcriptional regulator